PAAFVNEPECSRRRNRMAIIRRIAPGGMMLQLALDIRKHAAGAKPEQLRFKPGIAELLLHKSKPVKRLLRRANAARGLEAHRHSSFLSVPTNGARHDQADRQRCVGRFLTSGCLYEVR